MPLRTFADREGEEWRVWSVTPASNAAATLDKAFRGGWLCFEKSGDGERRRLTLTETPAGWESLDESRLDLLCRVATPVAAHSLDAASGESARSLDDAARNRRSGPKTVVGGDDEELEDGR